MEAVTPASGGGEHSAESVAENERLRKRVDWLEARINRMTENCGWCQETCSDSGGFSPCPLHEGGERAAIGKDEITGRYWFYCPNCGARTDGRIAGSTDDA